MCWSVSMAVTVGTALSALLKLYSPAAMPDCTYSLNRFFIQEFSQPYAAFLLRSSRHSLIANRLQCSQLVERCTLHAAFFAASNEFISFPLHSFARHQHTHMQTHPDTYRERESEGERWRKSGTDTTADRETLRSQFHCSAATSPGQDEHHSDIATSCTQTRTSACNDDDIAKTQSPHSAESDRPSTNTNANLNL